MAFFGAPEPQKTHAVRACNTALLMQRRLDELNKVPPPDWVEVHVRMGVNTADVFVGNMGSNTRFNYTVMGDGVNLASRLEGINKLFGTRTLISEMTLIHVRNDPANADRFYTREVGRFVVKGKKEPAAVYELMAFADDVSPVQEEIKHRYEAALAAFYERDFDTARSGFDALWSEHEDKASQFMLLQLDDFRDNPPGEQWKGDIRLMTK
jgi:adenylate cyclase